MHPAPPTRPRPVHSAGDLTTNNILLVESLAGSERPFRAKVSDFGLSRIASSESILTNTFGTVLPPLSYSVHLTLYIMRSNSSSAHIHQLFTHVNEPAVLRVFLLAFHAELESVESPYAIV